MLEFKNITVEFGEKKVFDDFNLKVNKGDKVLLNAPSGKGKSTLFNMLLGFVQPKEGSIIFEGKELDKKNLNFFRKSISYVSQDVDFRKIIVEELIREIFSYNINKRDKLDEVRLKELLDYFNLDKDIMKKNISMLSGGERQRMGIIVALMLDRDIFLLDEVTSALDKEMKRKAADFVMKSEKTVLIISHDSIWNEYENIKVVGW